MNILQQEDIIKGLPDQALQEEAKKPSGQVPQFLVVSEIQRRTDMRKKYQDPNKEQPQGTIADQITQEGIASVQPQQPMQGEQQQGQPMPMRGGGMTPFMAKYANGGRAEGYLPNLMATPLDQYAMNEIGFDNKISELFNSGLSLDQIKSVVGKQFGSEAVNRVDQLANPDLLSQQVEDDYDLYSRNNPSMPVPPMPVENVTDPRLLTLNGVNTLTPDGQRPYPPDTPSVDTLEQFSNAFKEDAERANNLLATLNNATPEEEEAISNPVSVNLPEIRTLDEIGKDAPQSLKGTGTKLASAQEVEDSKYDPSSFGAMFDGPSREFLPRAGKVVGHNLSEIGTSIGDWIQDIKSSSGTSIDQGVNYLGSGADADADADADYIRNLVGVNGSNSSSAEDLINFAEQQGSPSRKELIANSRDIAEEQNAYLGDLGQRNLDAANRIKQRRERDGANSEGSGDIGVNNSNKAVNLLNNAFELDLDATKKEAFAMAMIQLGAGIAKGDLAEGLSNAGVAASGVLESSRDRSDKQLDREIQRKYYADKLSDSRLARNESLKSRAQAEARQMMAAWYKTPAASKAISDPSIASDQEETYYQLALKRLTQAATGEDMKGGGSESDRIMSYSPSTGLQSPT